MAMRGPPVWGECLLPNCTIEWVHLQLRRVVLGVEQSGAPNPVWFNCSRSTHSSPSCFVRISSREISELCPYGEQVLAHALGWR